MAKPTLTTSAVVPYHGGELARNGHEQVHMGNVGLIQALIVHMYFLGTEFIDNVYVFLNCAGLSVIGFLFARTVHQIRRGEFSVRCVLEEEVAQREIAEARLRLHQENLEKLVVARTE